MELSSFKVALVGTQKVGKTSLLNKFHFGTFDKNTVTTVGASFIVHKFNIEGKDISFQIWDTAGQERYRSLGPIYYRDASCALSVFDTTSSESFEDMKIYINQFKAYCSDFVHIAVIGNKFDLFQESGGMDLVAIRQWAQREGFSFHLTSALTGEGVSESFQDIALTVVSRQKEKHDMALKPRTEKSNCC